MPYHANFAKGSVLGALVGDAAGARLELIGRMPTPDEVEEALAMLGGGIWNVAPGQITDDGEMTLALATALAQRKRFPADIVARNYVRWYKSSPFDIGHTTSKALRNLEVDSPNLVSEMLDQSARHNLASKANGSLMRASALGAWAACVDRTDAISAAQLDARLTHPNPSCQWASAAYVLAIRHLVLQPGESHQAFDVAVDTVRSGSDDGAREVLGWLSDAESGRLPSCHPNAGFVRIGFTHAFSHLLQQTPFTQALRSMLTGGGDTDTNACIVGGLLGALHGQSVIPGDMASAILNCDTKLSGNPRPIWLRTNGLLDLLVELTCDQLLDDQAFDELRRKRFLIDESVSMATPICHSCRHWRGDLTCSAFPDGTPLDVMKRELKLGISIECARGVGYEQNQ